MYFACRAQQALLDGKHSLCWQACERASILLREQSLGEIESNQLSEAVTIMTFRLVCIHACFMTLINLIYRM
jgi:hypothetical protein